MGKRKDSVEGVSLRDILNEAGKFLDKILSTGCLTSNPDGLLRYLVTESFKIVSMWTWYHCKTI